MCKKEGKVEKKTGSLVGAAETSTELEKGAGFQSKAEHTEPAENKRVSSVTQSDQLTRMTGPS